MYLIGKIFASIQVMPCSRNTYPFLPNNDVVIIAHDAPQMAITNREQMLSHMSTFQKKVHISDTFQK
jgi:hypothetical protein